MNEQQREFLRQSIRTIKDYPKAGIQFRDITTLLRDAKKKKAFRRLLAMRAGDIPLGWYFAGRRHKQKAFEITQACHSVNKQLVTDALRWFPELAARKRKRRRRKPPGR